MTRSTACTARFAGRPGRRLATLLLCVLALPGCFSQWTRVPENGAEMRRGDFTAPRPAGWMVFEGSGSQHGDLTLDGLAIQSISFEERELDDAFPTLEREASPGLLPSELAELTVAERRANGLDNLEVLSEGPAVVAGQEAFRLHLRHKTATGLRVDHLLYGFVTTQGFYLLHYAAPTLYYFERDEAVFENLVRGVK